MDQIEAEIEQTEAIAVSLAVLARPVTSADIPAAAAVDMREDAPAMLEEAIRAGEAARVGFMGKDRQAFGRVCVDDAALVEFFRGANARGEIDGSPVARVTRWQPREISLVAIGADSSVGIGRSAPGGGQSLT